MARGIGQKIGGAALNRLTDQNGYVQSSAVRSSHVLRRPRVELRYQSQNLLDRCGAEAVQRGL
jgi:hypothetical protein